MAIDKDTVTQLDTLFSFNKDTGDFGILNAKVKALAQTYIMTPPENRVDFAKLVVLPSLNIPTDSVIFNNITAKNVDEIIAIAMVNKIDMAVPASIASKPMTLSDIKVNGQTIKANTTVSSYLAKRQPKLIDRITKDLKHNKLDDLINKFVKIGDNVNTTMRDAVYNQKRIDAAGDRNGLYKIIGRLNTDAHCLEVQKASESGWTWEEVTDALPIHPNCMCLITEV
jgi:hypothetical protein